MRKLYQFVSTKYPSSDQKILPSKGLKMLHVKFYLIRTNWETSPITAIYTLSQVWSFLPASFGNQTRKKTMRISAKWTFSTLFKIKLLIKLKIIALKLLTVWLLEISCTTRNASTSGFQWIKCLTAQVFCDRQTWFDSDELKPLSQIWINEPNDVAKLYNYSISLQQSRKKSKYNPVMAEEWWCKISLRHALHHLSSTKWTVAETFFLFRSIEKFRKTNHMFHLNFMKTQSFLSIPIIHIHIAPVEKCKHTFYLFCTKSFKFSRTFFFKKIHTDWTWLL